MKIISLIILLFFTSNILADSDHYEVSPTDKKIVKITKNGLFPKEIILTKSDSSVFFLNDLEQEEVNLKISVKSKILHCASTNLKVENDFLVTVSPVKPSDFEVSCFPDSGIYDFEVSGVNVKSLKGTIKAQF